MRPILLLLSASLLQGCCCCNLPFGGGGGGGDDMSMMEEWAAEKTAEKIVEGVTGSEMDLDVSGQKASVTTDEGTMTIWSDGKVPEGYPFAIPADSEISAVTRLEPKKDVRATAWSAMGESKQPPAEIVAFLRAEAESRGYTVHSMSERTAEVIERLEEEGAAAPAHVEMPSVDEGEVLQFSKGEGVFMGQAIVGESEGGVTEWMIMLAPEADTQAEAPPEIAPVGE